MFHKLMQLLECFYASPLFRLFLVETTGVCFRNNGAEYFIGSTPVCDERLDKIDLPSSLICLRFILNALSYPTSVPIRKSEDA